MRQSGRDVVGGGNPGAGATLLRLGAPVGGPVSVLARAAASPRARAAGPVVVIVAVVVVANLLYLAGLVQASPLYSVANVGTTTVAHLLPGLSTIDPNSGYTAQALGHRAAIDILHGQLPWWNPFEGAGAPLAGEMQSAALFPPTLLLALSWGQLPFHVLLEAIAGIATYRVLVRLDVAPWIAAAGGCAFALNGTFAWFQHAPVNPIAFLPLLILGVERARASALDGTRHRWGLIALALALSLYAGFPETAYLDGLLALVWALVRTVGLSRERILRYWRKLVSGGVVGMLLAAPILAAFIAYLPVGNLAGHASNFNGVAIPRPGITSLVFPYAFGPIFAAHTPRSGTLDAVWGSVGGYLSAALLALDAIALYARRLRPLRIVLALWIVVTVGRTYGFTPFRQVFGLLPAMEHVAAYRYLPPSFELAGVVLAVLAIDDIRRHAVPRWFAAAALLAALVVAGAVAYEGRSIFDSISTLPHHAAAEGVWLAWGFGIIVVIGATVLFARGRLRNGVLVACLVVDALGMFVAPELSAPRQASIDSRFIDWMQHHVGLQRFYTLGPIHPDYGSYFGLPQANINDLPIPKRYSTYITSALDPNVNPIQFTGNTLLDPSGTTPLQAFEAHLAGYRAIGVAYLVATPGAVPVGVARSLHLQSAYSDGFATVYRVPHPAPYYSVRSGACTFSHETLTSVVVDCRTVATVDREQLEMDGWSASASGRSVPVAAAGRLFQAVRLRPGRATLQYSFVPPREGFALVALLVGLLVLVAGWWRAGRRQPSGSERQRATARPDPAAAGTRAGS